MEGTGKCESGRQNFSREKWRKWAYQSLITEQMRQQVGREDVCRGTEGHHTVTANNSRKNDDRLTQPSQGPTPSLWPRKSISKSQLLTYDSNNKNSLIYLSYLSGKKGRRWQGPNIKNIGHVQSSIIILY